MAISLQKGYITYISAKQFLIAHTHDEIGYTWNRIYKQN